jgi:hypothetical protein
MTSKNYLILCVAVAVVVSLSILFVPGVAKTIERELLTFLSTNARG